jgi:hypothetical protein
MTTRDTSIEQFGRAPHSACLRWASPRRRLQFGLRALGLQPDFVVGLYALGLTSRVTRRAVPALSVFFGVSISSDL